MNERCFCCGFRSDRAAAQPWTTCLSCGAMWRPSNVGDRRTRAEQLAATLAQAEPSFPRFGECDWFMDAFTARIAGTASGRWLQRADDAFVPGHDRNPPVGHWIDLPTIGPLDIELVALAKPADPALPSFIDKHAGNFAWTTVVLDAERVPEAIPAPANADMIARPLAGDFGAQRNAAMTAARCPWVFHLDLDETVDATFAKTIRHLAGAAEKAGIDAVGFPRRNLVDGVPSDLYPDVQYRLLRRGQRYVGAVHERPKACDDWPTTTISLSGEIDHHLTRERVLGRNRQYDALGQQAERRDEEAALLSAFDG